MVQSRVIKIPQILT